MIPGQPSERLSGWDGCWLVLAAENEPEPVERFLLGPPRGGGRDPTEGRVARHLDAVGKGTELL